MVAQPALPPAVVRFGKWGWGGGQQHKLRGGQGECLEYETPHVLAAAHSSGCWGAAFLLSSHSALVGLFLPLVASGFAMIKVSMVS